MDNNQRRRFFTNQNHAASQNEQERFRQQLTEALDTLGAYFTEVRRLQVELTSQLSSSELNIGWWQARYTQEHRRHARVRTQAESFRTTYESLRTTYNSLLEDYRQLRQDNRNFRNNIVPERIRHLEEEINRLRQNYDFLLKQRQERSTAFNLSSTLGSHAPRN